MQRKNHGFYNFGVPSAPSSVILVFVLPRGPLCTSIKQIFTLNEGMMQNKAHRLQKLELRKLPERIQDHSGGVTPEY